LFDLKSSLLDAEFSDLKSSLYVLSAFLGSKKRYARSKSEKKFEKFAWLSGCAFRLNRHGVRIPLASTFLIRSEKMLKIWELEDKGFSTRGTRWWGWLYSRSRVRGIIDGFWFLFYKNFIC
jgi:hypothetical protein